MKSDWSTFWPTLCVTVIGTVFLGGLASIVVARVSAEIQQGIADEAAAIATCNNPQQLRLANDVGATATSQLSYTDGNNQPRDYPAANLTDGSRQTAWIAAPENAGVGAEITLALPEPYDVRLICILNGYSKTVDLYDANGSARVLEVATASGVRDAALPRVTDVNVFEYQQLTFAPGVTREVVLTVQASDIPAASADFGPTSASVSEIELWIRD